MADNVEIQGLEFQIVNNSTQAVAGLQNLINTLNRLKTATNGGATGLSKTAQGIRELSNSLKGLNSGDASQKITRLANALTALSQVGNVKISSSIANQLTAINTALNNLKWTDGDKLTALANGLRPLSELGKANMTTFINQLSKLPKVIEDLEAADIDKFTRQMNDLAAAMKPFADEMQKVSNGFSAFPSKIQKVITSSEKYNSTMSGATARTNTFGTALKGLKFVSLAVIFRKVSQFLGSAINRASEYLEDMNLFTVSMGEYAEEAYKYAQQVSEVMGIDPAEWMRNQGVFNTIITGFGVASDKAALMSKNLTQLGYDISSFYNISFAESMQKVQSGIAGELEPLRRIGYDLSVARLQQEAYNLGITKSVSAMTQAEKAQLRYYTMMTQVTQVQGDMARTLEQPTNMIRVLKAQLEQAARAIGDLFIPALTKILPIVIAVAKALREIIAAVAALFGVELQTPDWSNAFEGASVGSGEIADNMDDAAGAAKKLKQYVAGFDELNIIPSNDSSGNGSDMGLGSDLGIDLPEYDFLKGAVTDQIDEWQKKLQPFVDGIKANLNEILNLVKIIGVALFAWKLSQSFLNSIMVLKNLAKAGLSIPLTIAAGGVLTGAGFTVEFSGIKNAIQKGLNKFNFGEIILGGLTGTAGAGLLGKGIGQFIAKAFSGSAVAKAITAGGGTISTGLIGAAIGGIVAGIPMFVTGVYDAIVNGLNTLNGLLILAGSTLAGAGVGAIIGSLGGPIGTGVGALIGLVIGGLTDIGIAISENWDEIKEFFSPVAEWFDANVIQPISGFFSELWENVSIWAGDAWQGIEDFFSPAVTWFSELWNSVSQTFEDVFYNIGVIASGTWETIKIVWGMFSNWFHETVIQPVAVFFSELWEDVSSKAIAAWDKICSVYSDISDWIDLNVIQPVADVFNDLKEAIHETFEDVVDFFKGIINGVLSALNSAISSAFGKINSILSSIKGFEIAGKTPFSKVREISVPQIPLLANGGFVDQGQLFIAREAGAEMVGQMGNRTAVANNDQIVAGISAGVSDANEELVNAIFAIGSMIVKSIEDKDTSTSFDYKSLSRNLHPYLKQEDVIHGKSLVNA